MPLAHALHYWKTLPCACTWAGCSIKAGQEKRLQEKKKESMRKKERSRRDWD
jgi:hypothetical protein